MKKKLACSCREVPLSNSTKSRGDCPVIPKPNSYVTRESPGVITKGDGCTPYKAARGTMEDSPDTAKVTVINGANTAPEDRKKLNLKLAKKLRTMRVQFNKGNVGDYVEIILDIAEKNGFYPSFDSGGAGASGRKTSKKGLGRFVSACLGDAGFENSPSLINFIASRNSQEDFRSILRNKLLAIGSLPASSFVESQKISFYEVAGTRNGEQYSELYFSTSGNSFRNLVGGEGLNSLGRPTMELLILIEKGLGSLCERGDQELMQGIVESARILLASQQESPYFAGSGERFMLSVDFSNPCWDESVDFKKNAQELYALVVVEDGEEKKHGLNIRLSDYVHSQLSSLLELDLSDSSNQIVVMNVAYQIFLRGKLWCEEKSAFYKVLLLAYKTDLQSGLSSEAAEAKFKSSWEEALSHHLLHLTSSKNKSAKNENGVAKCEHCEFSYYLFLAILRDVEAVNLHQPSPLRSDKKPPRGSYEDGKTDLPVVEGVGGESGEEKTSPVFTPTVLTFQEL